MRIECKATFLDGQRRFEAGDTVTVSDEDGARFIAQGWAVAPSDDALADPSDGATTLAVDNVTHKKGSRNG